MNEDQRKEHPEIKGFPILSTLLKTVNGQKGRLAEKFKREWLISSQEKKESYQEFVKTFICNPMEDLLFTLFPEVQQISLIHLSQKNISITPKLESEEEVFSQFIQEKVEELEKQDLLPYWHYDLKNTDSFLLLFRVAPQQEGNTEFSEALHYYQDGGSLFFSVRTEGKKELEELEDHNKSTLLISLSLIFTDFVHTQLNLWEQWVIEKLRRESFAIQKKKTQFQSLNLRNLRSYGAEGQQIEIKPITLITAPNSSGKSTILKTLLMLKHTQESKMLDQVLSTHEMHADFGSPLNFFHKRKPSSPFSIILEYQNESQNPSHLELIFNSRTKQKELILDQLYWKDQKEDNSIQLKKILQEKTNQEEMYNLELRYIEPESRRKMEVKQKISLSHSTNLFQVFGNLALNWPIPYVFPNFSSSVRYLSSFREMPRRSYPITYDNPLFLDYEGKNFVDHWFREEQKISQENGKLEKWKKDKKNLIGWTNHWVERLGLGKELVYETGENQLGKLKLVSFDGQRYELLDSGLGANHLLPIIAQGVLAGDTDTLLFENPELHLHPKLQGDLAELFWEILQRSGKQRRLVIETHSEYLISRLQTLIAVGNFESDHKNSLKPEDVVAYYCDLSRKDGTTNLIRLTFDEEGYLEQEFPEGFFEESSQEVERRTDVLLEKSKKQNI